MSRAIREHYEFSKATRIEALRRAEYRCEQCGKSDKEVGKLFIHHKLMIEMAARYYQDISCEVIKSLANAEVLCDHCHKVRDEQARREHGMFALALKLMSRLEKAG